MTSLSTFRFNRDGNIVTITTEWSIPGETAGIRERYQQRNLGGLFLSAGSNHIGPDRRFVLPDTETPWHVYADLPDPHLGGLLQMKEIAGGFAASQEEARAAAEQAATDYLATTSAEVAA